MFIKSYSKINLSLKVNYKLKNGLHEIQSFYCWINLFDKIKIKNSVKNLLIKADIFYNSSLNGLRFIPIKSRVSILIALRIYQAIGHKINKTGTKFLNENVYITVREKFLIIIKSLIEFLIFFVVPFHRKHHNKNLHKPLSGLIDANTK